jgi:hypothetical protein
VGKSFVVQAIGDQAIKAGYTVYYRSIFDLVRDYLHDEVLGQEDEKPSRYPEPELLLIDISQCALRLWSCVSSPASSKISPAPYERPRGSLPPPGPC